MTVSNDIRIALETQLLTVTGLPASAQRAWENVRFEPTTGTTWVQATVLPAESRPAVMGGDPQQLYTGLFQVDIFTPEGEGPAEAETLADNVRLAFAVDDVFTSGSVNVRFRYSERIPAPHSPPWYRARVNVAWYTYRP
jgi:hypothetical protein